MPVVGPIWHAQGCDEEAATRLASALRIEPAVARLLCQRGLDDPDLALRFLNPALEHLHDPMRLADMRVAVDRIMSAIARKERIAIHGELSVQTNGIRDRFCREVGKLHDHDVVVCPSNPLL